MLPVTKFLISEILFLSYLNEMFILINNYIKTFLSRLEQNAASNATADTS
jgi:hypothetical protein